jgi:hypothetical protein
MTQEVDSPDLLDAIDGIAYLVDATGVIQGIGASSWDRFARDNDAPGLTAGSVLGTSMLAGIDGADVRATCLRLHESVCQRQRRVTYEYRCDGRSTERRMRMSISPVASRQGGVLALYQSQLVSEAARLPLGLLPAEHRATCAGGLQLAICSYCHAVAWPIGAAEPQQSRIGIEEFYRRGGNSQISVSHGICPQCVERIIEPNV